MGQFMPELLAALTGSSTSAGVAPKLSIFAGHDACPMMPVMVALGVWDGTWPDYASLLALELVSVDGEEGNFVRAIYKGNAAGQPSRAEQREITGCARPGDGLCPLEDFLELALKSVPADIGQACVARTGPGVAPVSDHCPEVCKEVLLGPLGDGVDGWGAGRHAGPEWVRPR